MKRKADQVPRELAFIVQARQAWAALNHICHTKKKCLENRNKARCFDQYVHIY